MASFSKPTRTPIWAATSGNVVEPPLAKKNEGWLFEETPPSSFENDRAKLVGEWFDWLNERIGDGGTADIFQILDPATSSPIFQLQASGVEIINGLNVGIAFGGTVTDDRLNVGDVNFGLALPGSDPSIVFDSGPDDIFYDRTLNSFNHRINNITEMTLRSTGLNITNGLVVGNTSTAPTDDDVIVLGGMTVGHVANPVAGSVSVGDGDFFMFLSGSTATLGVDSGNSMRFDRTANNFIFDTGSDVFTIGPTFHSTSESIQMEDGSEVLTPSTTDEAMSSHRANAIFSGGTVFISGTFGGTFNVASVNNSSTGVYVVTHDVNSDTVDGAIVASAFSSAALTVVYDTVTQGAVTFRIRDDSGTLTNARFSFMRLGGVQ